MEESYNKIKKILAMGFIDFLEEQCKDGKMCVSNAECADIEKAFSEKDWDKLSRYVVKYLA